MLDNLTAEQEAMCDVVAAEYIADITRPTPTPLAADDPAILNWLDTVYKLYAMKWPERIEVVASPFAALALAEDLTGAKHVTMDYCGAGEASWVSFYDLFNRIGVLKDDEVKDLIALRDFGRAAWDTILLDECAIIIRRPLYLKTDDDGNLHASDGPCIEWADGRKEFAWHGTWVTERIVVDPRSHTAQEYKAITNTEVRRALSESAGWAWVAQLLGAEVSDAWKDETTGLTYELMTCADGSQKLLKKQSPSLEDGAQPFYMEPVHENLKTAKAARKWQATNWTPEACEKDPELRYQVET